MGMGSVHECEFMDVEEVREALVLKAAKPFSQVEN